jgi:hypothetical protein
VIVDSSALIAISRGEPESAVCFRALLASLLTRISAANWLEATIVVDGWRDPEASRELDALIERFKVVVEPFTRHGLPARLIDDLAAAAGTPPGSILVIALPTRWRRISMSRCSLSARTLSIRTFAES